MTKMSFHCHVCQTTELADFPADLLRKSERHFMVCVESNLDEAAKAQLWQAVQSVYIEYRSPWWRRTLDRIRRMK